MNFTAMHVEQQQQEGGEENGPVWHVVANKSQFDFEHGRSACVAIACEAAIKILCLLGDKESIPRQGVKPEMLLESMEGGIDVYKSIGRQGHLELDDVIFSEKYSSQLSVCKREQKCLKAGLEHMLFFEILSHASRKHCKNAPTALLFVKGGEAALVVLSNNGKQILLFNSHPKSEININFSKCFVSSVDDMMVAAGFLTQLFPCVTGLGFGLQADMYNMFDLAIVKLSQDLTNDDMKEDNVPVAQQLQSMDHNNTNNNSNAYSSSSNVIQLTPDLQALVSQGIISREAALVMM